MKKLTLLLILLIGSFSYGQVILYQNAPDRQKITEFEKRNDSLVISLENSGTNKVYLGDLRTDISGKANINSPTFTGNVVVPTATISDAAVNLGQMMDSLATVGTGLIQELASTKTLTKEDAWIIYRNRSVGDSVTYTIPNQANGGFTEDIGYTFYTKTTGKIFVKGETGSGVEPVEISGAGQYATITRFGSNTWDWSKGVLPWTPPVDHFADLNPTGYWNADDLSDGTITEWADRTTGKKFITQIENPLVETRGDGKKEVSFANSLQASLVGESNWPEIDINFRTDNYTFVIHAGDNIADVFSSHFLYKGIDPSTQFRLLTNSSGNNGTLTVSGLASQNLSNFRTSITDGFVVFIKNSDNIDVYVNNSLLGSWTIPVGANEMNSNPWGISQRPGAPLNNSQNWSLRKLVFYDKILTPSELSTLYSARND